MKAFFFHRALDQFRINYSFFFGFVTLYVCILRLTVVIFIFKIK
jgi:hypothetical protein